MKTQKILQSPIAKKMYDLKFESSLAIIKGQCRKARQAQKEYARLAVNNFHLAFDVPNPVNGTIPLFSKAGFNTLKFMIFKAFTKKSPEEKKLREMKIDYYDSILRDVYQ